MMSIKLNEHGLIQEVMESIRPSDGKVTYGTVCVTTVQSVSLRYSLCCYGQSVSLWYSLCHYGTVCVATVQSVLLWSVCVVVVQPVSLRYSLCR
jgi:hypothetical protein